MTSNLFMTYSWRTGSNVCLVPLGPLLNTTRSWLVLPLSDPHLLLPYVWLFLIVFNILLLMIIIMMCFCEEYNTQGKQSFVAMVSLPEFAKVGSVRFSLVSHSNKIPSAKSYTRTAPDFKLSPHIAGPHSTSKIKKKYLRSTFDWNFTIIIN